MITKRFKKLSYDVYEQQVKDLHNQRIIYNRTVVFNNYFKQLNN